MVRVPAVVPGAFLLAGLFPLLAGCQSPPPAAPPSPSSPPTRAMNEVEGMMRELHAGWERQEGQLQEVRMALQRFMERVERLEMAFKEKGGAREKGGALEKEPKHTGAMDRRGKLEAIEREMQKTRAHLEELEAVRRKVAAEAGEKEADEKRRAAEAEEERARRAAEEREKEKK